MRRTFNNCKISKGTIFWTVIGIVCIALIAVLSSIGEIQRCQWFNASIGHTVIIAITAILVLFYVIDTHSIAQTTKIELRERLRPMIGFELFTRHTSNDLITYVLVRNNSMFFCEVYTDFNIQVYNNPIEHSPKYAGKEPWYVLPGQATRGWFSISDVLRKAGKNLPQVTSDRNYDIAQKLFIDVHIKAKGTPGETIEYPKLHWYFDFSRSTWVYMS